MAITLAIQGWRTIAERHALIVTRKANPFRAARLMSLATGFDCVVTSYSKRPVIFRDGVKQARTVQS